MAIKERHLAALRRDHRTDIPVSVTWGECETVTTEAGHVLVRIKAQLRVGRESIEVTYEMYEH
jgi:hypothetical protein